MTILSRIGAVRDADRAHAIARNVDAVLNTKRGYGGALDHFGLPDHVIEGGTDALVERLAAGVEQQIVAFEPRLCPVDVTAQGVAGTRWVRLLVEGVDGGWTHRLQVRIDTWLRHAEVSVLAEVDR